MDGRQGKQGERRSTNTLFHIDCEFPSCGLLEVPLKNSKATGNKTQALAKEDTCSFRASRSLEPGMRSPLLPHPPHPPLPPFHSHTFHLEFTSRYLKAPSSLLSASSSGAARPDPRDMARLRATSKNVCLCLRRGPVVHAEKGGLEVIRKPLLHPHCQARWPFSRRSL